ncbi:hypothetical protein AAG747_23460 [Rapidithrix thailandica]|uniref:Uncharacterized protein n=1 Tax=Rapidithrix thailandica TaxID=413964 RepID=A0AAW9SAF3_9BACT
MKKTFSTIAALCVAGCVWMSCSETKSTQENEAASQTTTPTHQPVEPAVTADTKFTSFPAFFTHHFVQKEKSVVLPTLKQLIHSDHGVYLSYKPGMSANIQHLKSAKELLEWAPRLSASLEGLDCKIAEGELPEFDFVTGEFAENGCFYSTQKARVFSEKYASLREEAMLEPTAEEIKQAQKMDALITENVVITEARIGMQFANIEEKWYLIGVDVSSFDMTL